MFSVLYESSMKKNKKIKWPLLLFSLISVVSLFFTPLNIFAKNLTAQDITIAAVGDIACDPASVNFNSGQGANGLCQMMATAEITDHIPNLKAVLPLGDNQYEKGNLEAFNQSYNPSWGKFNPIAYPVPGNHEYLSKGAQGYYQYFGKRAHHPGKGYYSYDLGNWHLIALNSNCEEVGGCGIDSPQEKWLRDDLKIHNNLCTLAYWHHPRFSSGSHGDNPTTDAFWQDLYQAKTELVLVGHDHIYERFAPQNASGALDRDHGIREIVVGTGGKNHYRIEHLKDNSQVQNADSYGVLKLILKKNKYSWQFLATSDSTFKDQGENSCF